MNDREYELSVRSLRAEVHEGVDKARVRERLVARGVLTGAALGATTGAAAKAGSSWLVISGTKLATALTVLTVASVAVVSQMSKPRAVRRPELTHVFNGPEHERQAPRPEFAQHAAEKAFAPPIVATRRAVQRTTHERDNVLDLARENALISAAVTALRAGELTRATAFLQQHEQEFPNGFLRAERDKTHQRVDQARRNGSRPR